MSRTTRTSVESANPHAVLEPTKPAKIIVEIEGDTLTFRQKGGRRRFTISMAEAMREAIIRTAQ